MADVAFGAAGSVALNVTTASGTPGVPAGVVAGSVLVLFLYKENAAAITWPTGFAQFATVVQAASNFWLFVAWKRSTGGGEGAYSPSWTGSTYNRSVAVRYDNAVAAGSPPDQTNTEAPAGTGATLLMDGLDPAFDRTLHVLFGGCFDSAASPWAQVAPTTERVDSGEFQISDVLRTAATATGATTLDPSGTFTRAGIEFNLIGTDSVAEGAAPADAVVLHRTHRPF